MKILKHIFLALTSLAAAASLHAAPFAATNIVIVRVGTGTGNLINSGNPVFLDEYTTSGTFIQSIAMPTTQVGSQWPLIIAGTSGAEGLLTRSVDGRYLLVSGYGTSTGGAALAGTASTSVPRVIGRVDYNGNVDTSTGLTNWTSANSPRCAASTDGTAFWGGGGTGLNYASALGITNSVPLNNNNVRGVVIFDHQLYISSAAAAVTRGVASVGSGLPTTAGQTATILPGMTDNVSLKSPYAFVFCHLNGAGTAPDTLYVCDDTTAGAPGGINKFSLVSGLWTTNGSVGAPADSYRGLCASVNGTTVTLFATRKGGSTATGGGELVKIVDATGYNAAIGSPTITLLATAAANTAFRGVALAPVSLPVSTMVTTTEDSGPGSLRQMVLDAPPNATITFTNTLSGATLLLTNGQLLLDRNLTIDASALTNGIAIDGNNGRIFQVASNTINVLTALAITNGNLGNRRTVGGGILNYGTLTVNRCTLAGNLANWGGGIYNLGTLTVNQSTFSGNTADGRDDPGDGAGILNYGTLTVNQSTFSGNTALGGGGGGGINNQGTLTVNQSTLSSNTASIGGGIFTFDPGTLTLSNSIVAGNSATFSDADLAIFSGTVTAGVNLTNGAPYLAPLGHYGGPTQTMPPLPGSPAIDGCTNGSGFLTDQRGATRPVGPFADIGAVEGVFDPNFQTFNPTRLGDGSFQFSFTNLSGASFTVFASTNVALPLAQWQNLGVAAELFPNSGLYQFTDPQGTNDPQRFYNVRSP